RFKPSSFVSAAIIVAVTAMVGAANWRDSHRSRDPYTAAPPIGTPGAPKTSREELEQRVKDMDAQLAAHPDDAGAAMLLADALLRQTRVSGNPGLAVRAERVLARVLSGDPSNYDANRMLGALYLSQHRFRKAVKAGEKNRDAGPYDPATYGVSGDGHLELGEYDAAFDAYDRMMALRPSAGACARVS